MQILKAFAITAGGFATVFGVYSLLEFVCKRFGETVSVIVFLFCVVWFIITLFLSLAEQPL